jgi:uncharacterized membrane protein YedE/YeeE
MWLPTPIYERTPQLWLLMAVLFVALGLYIGLAYTLTYFYLALGVVCGVRGIQVWRMRSNFRRARAADGDIDSDSLADPMPN